MKRYRRVDHVRRAAIHPQQMRVAARRGLRRLRRLVREVVPSLRHLAAQAREGSPHRPQLRLPKSAFRVVAVAFWAATTARVLATYSGPGLHVTSLSVWVIPAIGFLLGILLWILPWIRIPAEQLFGSIVIGIALPLLYLSVVGNARSRDLLPVLGAAAIFTAALLPLRTAMAAALLGAVAAAIPLLAGWSGYYDRSLLILVSVIGLLTYVQARMMGTLGTDKRRAEAERRQIEESYVATISALAASIFAKEGSAEAHSRGSAALAVAVARRLGLRKRQLQLLEYAAVLQDVGKVDLPGYVLSKPGRVSDDELTMIRQHPVIAERILSVVPALAGITPVIRAQYERWNGSGYPDGLAGRAIPLGARILHVCLAYHAMTSDRPYRAALSQDEILAELREQAGKQFDPRVVDALAVVVRAGEVEAISRRLPAGQGSTPREWVQQLQTLEGLGNRLGSENSVEHICRAVVETVVALVPHDQAAILLLREGGQRLVPAYLSRSPHAESAESPAVQEVAVGEGIAGSVAETKRGIVVGDANRHPKASMASKVHESMLAAPVIFKQELLGVVVVSKLGLNQYTADHLRLVTIMANKLGASIANARMIERLGQARGPQQSAA